MAQIDTRHAEKTKLFELLEVKHNPESIDLQIARTKASMEKEDVDAVYQEFEALITKK
jgi:hypothetical protein